MIFPLKDKRKVSKNESSRERFIVCNEKTSTRLKILTIINLVPLIETSFFAKRNLLQTKPSLDTLLRNHSTGIGSRVGSAKGIRADQATNRWIVVGRLDLYTQVITPISAVLIVLVVLPLFSSPFPPQSFSNTSSIAERRARAQGGLLSFRAAHKEDRDRLVPTLTGN